MYGADTHRDTQGTSTHRGNVSMGTLQPASAEFSAAITQDWADRGMPAPLSTSDYVLQLRDPVMNGISSLVLELATLQNKALFFLLLKLKNRENQKTLPLNIC